MTLATTLLAWNCIRPVLSPFLYFPYAGLTYPILLDSRISLVALHTTHLFLVSLDYGSYDACVPPSATRQRHHIERVSRERVTLAPKQAIKRAARIVDTQPKRLQAKRSSGRSYTFSKILSHANCRAATLSLKSRGTATSSQNGNPATVSQKKQYRATSRGTGANLTRASSIRALVTTSMA